jgi:hypothetical protein
MIKFKLKLTPFSKQDIKEILEYKERTERIVNNNIIYSKAKLK